MITAMITASWTYVASCYLYRDGKPLPAIARTSGTNLQTGNAGTSAWTTYRRMYEATPNHVESWPIAFTDNPQVDVNVPIRYQIYANSGWNGGSNPFYFNNRDSPDMLGCSTISVWEIQT